jgi:hypothetical protein
VPSKSGFSFHELDRPHEEAVTNQEDRFMSASLSSSFLDLQARFVAIVPRITAHGEIYFRDVKCPGKKDDAVAEMIALSWAWFVRLLKKGKDPTTFVSRSLASPEKQSRAAEYSAARRDRRMSFLVLLNSATALRSLGCHNTCRLLQLRCKKR